MDVTGRAWCDGLDRDRQAGHALPQEIAVLRGVPGGVGGVNRDDEALAAVGGTYLGVGGDQARLAWGESAEAGLACGLGGGQACECEVGHPAVEVWAAAGARAGDGQDLEDQPLHPERDGSVGFKDGAQGAADGEVEQLVRGALHGGCGVADQCRERL